MEQYLVDLTNYILSIEDSKIFERERKKMKNIYNKNDKKTNARQNKQSN